MLPAAGTSTIQLISSVFDLVSQTFLDIPLATTTAAALWSFVRSNDTASSRFLCVAVKCNLALTMHTFTNASLGVHLLFPASRAGRKAQIFRQSARRSSPRVPARRARRPECGHSPGCAAGSDPGSRLWHAGAIQRRSHGALCYEVNLYICSLNLNFTGFYIFKN